MDNCPFKRKYDLVAWYNNYFGNSKGNKLSKPQLLAIWYRIAAQQREKSLQIRQKV